MSRYRCAAVMLVFIASMLPFSRKVPSQDTPSSQQERPRFETISIRPGSSKHDGSGAHETDLKFLPGGAFVTIHANLKSLISRAYEVPYLQVLEIPKSFEKADWNIEARPQEGKYALNNGLLDPRLGNMMIQAMLEDRFGLKVHRETRILQGYELVIAKGGPRIKPSDEQSKLVAGPIMPGNIDGHSISLNTLASLLSAHFQIWDGDQKRVRVIDKTGLKGLYSIRLRWTPDSRRVPTWPKPSADAPEITLLDAIQEQLGLKLEPANIPTEVVVVDEAHMPKTN